MKAHLPPIFFLVVLPVIATAQIQITGQPVKDAEMLRDRIAHRDWPAVIQVINSYHGSDYTSLKEIKDSITDNTFLTDLLKVETGIESAEEVNNLTDNSANAQSGPFFNFTPTAAIDALGTFIADRFKDELTVAYLEKFRARLDSFPQLKAIFPETYYVLKVNEPYQYTSFLETLREAFERDFENLPANIISFLNANPPQDISTHVEFFTSLLVLESAVRAFKGDNPVIILDEIEKSTVLESLKKEKDTTITNAIRLLSLASRAITSDDGAGWLNANDIIDDLKNDSTRKLFVGLLFEKERNSKVFTEVIIRKQTLYQILQSSNQKLSDYVVFLRKTADNIALIKSSYDKMKSAVNSKNQIPPTSADYLAFARQLIVSLSGNLKMIQSTFSVTLPQNLEIYLTTVSGTLDVFQELKDKKYGLAILDATTLVTSYLKDSSELKIYLLKYGTFAATVVKAETSQDILAALNSAALPVGSYRIKRNSFSDISLNAYAGGAAGLQFYTSPESVPDNVKASTGILTFSAPVGLGLSWGCREKIADPKTASKAKLQRQKENIKFDTDGDKKFDKVLTGGSFSLYFSVIDLGAVTSFRLTHDSSEALPELKWENVLAPGIFAIKGFRKSPVSIGVGAQYFPAYRKSIENEEVLPPVVIGKIMLAVDIPIFSFYTKAEK